MEYKIIEKINSSSFADDFLVLYDEKLYRLRKLKSIENLDMHSLSKFETAIKKIDYLGILSPELINLKDNQPALLFKHHRESHFENFNDENSLIKILANFFKIIDILVHEINFIPKQLNFEDFMMDSKNNIYYIAPFFTNFDSKYSMKFLNFDENDLIYSVLLFLKKLKKDRIFKNSYLEEFFLKVLSSEITCVSEFSQIFKMFFENICIINVKEPQYVGRKNLSEIFENKIQKSRRFEFFLIKGKQRVGKSRFMKMLEKQIVLEQNFFTKYIRNKKDILEFLEFLCKKNNINIINTNLELTKNIDLSIIDALISLTENIDIKIIFFIDDFHDVYNDFYELLQLIKNLELEKTLFFIVSTHEINLSLKFIMDNITEIFVEPFNFDECFEMVKSMLSEEFVFQNKEFIKIIYESSEGLPGNIEEIIYELSKRNILLHSEKGWNLKSNNIEFLNFEDYIEEKYKYLDKNLKKQIKLISSLGNSFTGTELNNLSQLKNIFFDMEKILESGIIKKEDYHYRFFNINYWEKFHKSLSSNLKKDLHLRMSNLTYSFDKKIWHLKQIKAYKSISYEYVKKIRNAFISWKNLHTLEESFKALEEMKIENYTALTVYTYYLFLNENLDEAKKYLEKLKQKKWMEYYYLVILNELDSEKTFQIIEKRLLEKNTLFQDFYLNTIKLSILANNSKFDESVIFSQFIKIESFYEKCPKTNQFVALYLRSLRIYSFYIRNTNHKDSNMLLEKSLSLSKKHGMTRYILLCSLDLAHLNINESQLYDSYVEEAISIAKSSNDLATLADVFMHKSYQSLYKGNIDEFFFSLQECIKYSKLTNNKVFEIQAIAIKCFFYMYIEDYENFDIEVLKILKFFSDSSENIRRRAFNYHLYLLSFYSLIKRSDNAVISYLEEIKNKGVTLKHMSYLMKIYLSNDPKEIKKEFLELFEGNVNLEECLIMLYYKFCDDKELSELYEKKAIQWSEKLKDSGQRLSYMLVYEALAKFYLQKKEFSSAFKYYRISSLYYNKNELYIKEKNLEKYFSSISGIRELVKTDDNDVIVKKSSKFYSDLLNISSKITSIDDIQEILDNILIFLKNKFPVSDIYLRIDSDMFEIQSVSNYEMVIPTKEIFSLEPLKIFFVSKNKEYTIKYYVFNNNLIVNLKIFEEIFDSIVILDGFLSGSLNRIIHQQNSIQDYLTGAFSRRYFYLRLEEEFEKSKRENRKLSLILFDVDNFKVVNDTYGHKKGDEVLKYVVKVTKENLRTFDIIGRYGGEEFVILLPETDPTQAYKIAERIRIAISKKSFEEFSFEVTASFGVTSLKSSEKSNSFQKLIELADEATYSAKKSGKNQVRVG